jgi:hypothetical protein
LIIGVIPIDSSENTTTIGEYIGVNMMAYLVIIGILDSETDAVSLPSSYFTSIDIQERVFPRKLFA